MLIPKHFNLKIPMHQTLSSKRRYKPYIYNQNMKQQFEGILTGSDSPVDGIVNKIDYNGFVNAYEFKSIDGGVHMVIAKDDEGNWQRIAGTEPYLSGWIDELAEQIN